MTNAPQQDPSERRALAAIKHHDVENLQRTPIVMMVEVASVAVFLAGEAYLAYRLWPFLAQTSWFMIATAALTAYVFADFISGFFHWMGDTWGSPETPLAGKVFVRPFREHHVDQKAITRHGFIEVNGANCAISLVPLLMTHSIPIETRSWGPLMAVFFGTFLFWIFLTNQFHSWSHQDDRPKVVTWLQKLHVILPAEHHQIHHVPPYNKYYCITNGWRNEPLYRMRFFPVLERIISAVTGMIPRKDDIGERAAVAVAGTQNEPTSTTESLKAKV